MPPKYPFSRSRPGQSSTSAGPSSSTPSRAQDDERPIVVSASGRAPTSPAINNLAAESSPSTLRSRIPSPRNIINAFTSDSRSSYPSPADQLSKGKTKRKKDKSSVHHPWQPLATSSPGRGNLQVTVPRYDARGYPIKENGERSPASPESTKTIRLGMAHSTSRDSLASDVSSTGAGVNEEQNRFLSPERPMSYYAPSSSDGHGSASGSGSTHYPPMSYSLAAPSYSPYDPYPQHGEGSDGHGYDNGYTYENGYPREKGKSPLPSLYGGSMVSLGSTKSEASMTHFRKYDALESTSAFSITSKGGKKHIFSLPADPAIWSYLGPEPDDDFHDPDVRYTRQKRFMRAMMTWRGVSNLGCLLFLLILVIGIFAVYPVLSHYLEKVGGTSGAYNLGGVNATGQLPNIGPFQLIDKDTPSSAYTWTSLETGDQWDLVFSDEFNRDGRTFYDGDDPYWEAVDLHYWQTNNLEWYNPDRVTTKNGSLIITLDKFPSHGLDYEGAMLSTWNRFCFTGGYFEAAVSLPGTSNVYGLWPAIWTMGNLGRAGYGGTLDGLWPYSYDSCDVGTLANQTLNGEPALTATEGDPDHDYALSYLPGQRLSSCTCPDDANHPGPKRDNGSFVGRAAPEIDMLEATVDSTTLTGYVSQSGQWAPFNPNYYVSFQDGTKDQLKPQFLNTSNSDYEVYDDDTTHINTYLGGVYQQATSGLSLTDTDCYTAATGCYSVYGFEYSPGASGYITWVSNAKKVWTVRAAAMAPNSDAGVGQRLVSEEPMYLILNLGLSENFGAIDYDGLESLWPVHMAVDYIRVYQDPNSRNIGCDPSDHPTASYISLYSDAYSDPNITTFDQVPNMVKPKNRLVDTC